MFCFYMVRVWQVTIILNSAGFDFGVKTALHLLAVCLLTSLRKVLLWDRHSCTAGHTAGQVVHHWLHSRPNSPT